MNLTENILIEAQIPQELPGLILSHLSKSQGVRAIDIARAIGYGDQWRLVAAAVKQLAQAGEVNIISHPNLGLFVFPKGVEAVLPGGKQIITPAVKPQTAPAQTAPTQAVKSTSGIALKTAKETEIAAQISQVLKSKPGLTQLEICQALGHLAYDMRTTMVIRELTIMQFLIVDKSAKPMTFSINPNYTSSTPRLQVAEKPKTPKAPKSNKAKKELADKIRQDLDYFRPGANYWMKNPAEVQEWGGKIQVVKEYRDLGTWVSDYENGYDRDEASFEDDDSKIWKDKKVFTKRIQDWVKTQSWARAVKAAYAEDHAEKSWGQFVIELK